MSIELSVRQVAGVTIFDLNGRMEAGNEGQTLHAALLHAFDQGHHWLLLNFAGLASMDSSGLGDLVDAHASILRRGGVVRLLHLNEHIAHLLAVTRLDSLLDVFDDESAALASFNSQDNQRTHQRLADYLKQDD
jgi:anti-sigma B factor antagonist